MIDDLIEQRYPCASSLRADPRTCDSSARGWRCQTPEHDADHGETDEGDNGSGITLEVAARRRLRLIQANVRSTIQRFGRATKRCASVRLTIPSFQQPVVATVAAILGPW